MHGPCRSHKSVAGRVPGSSGPTGAADVGTCHTTGPIPPARPPDCFSPSHAAVRAAANQGGHPMRSKFVFLALAALAPAGCAGGFRIGGNNYGAGIGAYIGPVPDALKQERCYSPPPAYPPPPAVELLTPTAPE